MSTTERLAALDAAFVALDRLGAPYIVGSVLTFERGPLAGPDGRLDLERLRAYTLSALDDLPRYRQRIGRVPLLGHPVWIDDERFDVARHVVACELAPPGGTAELEAKVGELLSQDLPADHPPWRLTAIDGMAGDRVALLSTVHHCLLDGITGVRVLARLLQLAPDPRVPDRRPPPVFPAPSGRELLRDELAHRWFGMRHLGSHIPGNPRRLIPALGALIRRGLHPASDAGLNPRRTGRARVFGGCELDLGEVKLIKTAVHATVNDVVLAIVAGGLRHFLRDRGVKPDELHDLRAMVPVSTHEAGEHALSGNRVALMLAPLPVDEAHPLRRLEKTRDAMRALKDASDEAAAGELLVQLSDVTVPALLPAILRLSLARRGFNVIITNVAGPPVPLYLLGARLLGFQPIVNLWPGQAIGVALLSYGGTLYLTVHADRAVVPDVAPLLREIVASFEDLRAVSRVTEATTSHAA